MTKSIPLTIGTVHFIGIGGIGMSGIAELLHHLGYKVQGSDIADGYNITRLRALGIEVFIGHQADNVKNAGVVVYSSAVKSNNPEMIFAREHKVPVVRRAEMLAELMRLKYAIAIGGTHGKTTTTTLVAALLDYAKLDPTVVNGGIINAYGTNARLGKGDWMVVEADESDGSFLKLPATIAVITNMDPEHLDHYGTAEKMNAAYVDFAQNVPFYGSDILCIDHPVVKELAERLQDKRVLTYGFNEDADLHAFNVRPQSDGTFFDIRFKTRHLEKPAIVTDLFLPMVGQHNVQNSLAAIAVAVELKVPFETVIAGLKSFSGVKRRFTQTGIWNGIRIIDDYGHHPIEIAAVLKAAKQTGANKVIAIVQPHRYSRLSALFNDFATCISDADMVFITDVYAAGENEIDGINGKNLVKKIQENGHKQAFHLESHLDLPAIVQKHAESGDIVVCLGAGSITTWANALPKQLEDLNMDAA